MKEKELVNKYNIEYYDDKHKDLQHALAYAKTGRDAVMNVSDMIMRDYEATMIDFVVELHEENVDLTELYN